MKNINAHYIKIKDNDFLSKLVDQELKSDMQSSAYIKKAMDSLKTRAHVTLDLINLAKIYLVDRELEISEEAKVIIDQVEQSFLLEIIELINNLTDTNPESISETFKSYAASKTMKLGDVMKFVRAIITGLIASPSVFEIISIIGKEHSIKRLQRFCL